MGADEPSAARLQLGARLRSLREAAGITGERAAAATGSSPTRISRGEGGRVPVQPGDVAALLDLYGVSGPADRDALLALAGDASRPAWWDGFPSPPTARVRQDLSLEAAASAINAYDGQAIPALLQTPAYAHAVCAADPGSTWRAGMSPRALARRRELTSAPAAPHLWALIGSAVLRRPPGGQPGVLREQVAYLLTAANWPQVTLQLVPEGAAAELSAPGPFALLRFAEPDLADAVLLEHLGSTAVLRGERDVEHYREIFELIVSSARTPGNTKLTLAEMT